MEQPVPYRTPVSGAQKRKTPRPVLEVLEKLPRAAACSVPLQEDPAAAEPHITPAHASGRALKDLPGNGEVLDLSVSRQGGAVSAPAAPEDELLEQHQAPEDEDIGLLNRLSLTEGQKRGILASRWVPPSNFQFPRRLMGSGASQKYRRCSAQLLQDYPFAHYSRHLDGVFCGPCFVFNSNKETVLVSTPLKDWSNGKKILERHSRSKEHGWATAKTEALAALERQKMLTERGQQALRQMVKVILLCGRHSILMGGSLAVTKTLCSLSRDTAELDPLLKESLVSGPLETPRHTVEKLLKLIGLYIQTKVLDRVKAARFFSLTVDQSLGSTWSLSLRYVHRSGEGQVEICEDPVDFVEAHGVSEKGLPDLFLQRIRVWGLQKELLRGYSCRGGSHPSGQLAGICGILPEAVCSASATQELTAAALRSCPLRPVTKLLDTLSKISQVLKSSGPGPLELRDFLRKEDEEESDPGEEEERDEDNRPEKDGPPRSPFRDMFSCFRAKYSTVLDALQKIAEDDGEAERLFYSITKFDFLVTLVCIESVLSCTRSLQLDLQWMDPDLIHLSEEASLVIRKLHKMKNKDDSTFDLLYDDVRHLAASVGVKEAPPLICGRLVSPDTFEDLQEGYRMSLFIPLLDHIISEIREQLLDCSPRFMAQYLIPDKLPLLESKEAEAALYEAFWRDISNLDSFHMELERWRENWREVAREDRPSSLLDTLQHLSPVHYPSINTALSILATMPISIHPGGRSSRTLQRVKVWQKNSGKGSQLVGMALLYIHQEMEVDVDWILQESQSLHTLTHSGVG